jgi:hypothetical protein
MIGLRGRSARWLASSREYFLLHLRRLAKQITDLATASSEPVFHRFLWESGLLAEKITMPFLLWSERELRSFSHQKDRNAVST